MRYIIPFFMALVLVTSGYCGGSYDDMFGDVIYQNQGQTGYNNNVKQSILPGGCTQPDLKTNYPVDYGQNGQYGQYDKYGQNGQYDKYGQNGQYNQNGQNNQYSPFERRPGYYDDYKWPTKVPRYYTYRDKYDLSHSNSNLYAPGNEWRWDQYNNQNQRNYDRNGNYWTPTQQYGMNYRNNNGRTGLSIYASNGTSTYSSRSNGTSMYTRYNSPNMSFSFGMNNSRTYYDPYRYQTIQKPNNYRNYYTDYYNNRNQKQYQYQNQNNYQYQRPNYNYRRPSYDYRRPTYTPYHRPSNSSSLSLGLNLSF